ncbi:TonB-dependent receptor [Caulobacter endophyticus]|uniref:TonB-dependent receptor n=1 Tax=Caulobacter endophyticus TaxID=2172652 RepID=UPI00240EC8E1|nr:TonB-dependent receptor [Caulobacter endophyticus]MDG2527228.1 TonB-dependent receptor [Caulobacter endophyticus]
MAARRAWLARSGSILGLAAGLATAIAVAPAAAEAPRRFAIDGGDLSQALNTFSRQADVPVMTLADIRHRTSRGVRGTLTPREALERLIAGQNLRALEAGGGYVLREAAPPAYAPAPLSRQVPPLEAPIEVEPVVVSGFRETMAHARDLKRRAPGAQEVILAEDIAAFPDLNLAESLQRIPGMTISRDSGEGRQIALRGLGPDFTRAQLNGMEVSASTASGMDNRGSVSRTRAFDYSIFASELFNRVTVWKSYAADQDEGGIGGTVELRTAKPFDYPGDKLAFSAKALTNGATDTVSPRFAALASRRWGDFGALVSVAYSENDANEYGYRNWGWSPVTFGAANVGPDVPRDVADRLINATGNARVVAPMAASYSTWFDHRTRLGLTFAGQYEPGTRMKLGVDLLYGRLTNDRDEFSLAAAGDNPLTGDVRGAQRLRAAEIRGNSLVYADYSSGVDLRSEHKRSEDATVFVQGALNGEFRAGERLLLRGMAGWSRSDFEGPVFDKVFLQARDKAFSYDLRDGDEAAASTYGFDPADPAAWSLMRADVREDRVINAFSTGRFDLDYRAAPALSLLGGVQYKAFRNDGYNRRTRTDYPAVGAPQAVTRPIFEKSLLPYVVADIDGTFARLGLARDLSEADDQPGSHYTITEKTWSAYIMARAQGVVADRLWRGDLGLRWYATDLTSAGMVNTGSKLEPAVIRNDYDGVLPALNLAVDVSPSVVVRLSANRNISRPSLGDLRTAGNVNSAPFGGTISSGNPNLRPFLADAVEAAVEVYQGRAGYLAVSLFHKRMDSFITTATSAVPYGSTGYPLAFLAPGNGPDTVYTFVRPVNGDGASIKGIELAMQRDLTFLPAPFDKLGVVGNVTRAAGRSNVLIEDRAVALDLFQLSRWTSNATLYYETPRWGARISSAYRSGYLDSAGGNGAVGAGYKASNNIDFAAHYNAPGGLRIVVEGVNLTNAPTTQYSDIVEKRLLARTVSGRTFTLGLTYEF